MSYLICRNDIDDADIFYLIQPAELIGTMRFKIGYSKKSDFERIRKAYKMGTRYINVQEVQNPFEIEKKLIELFNEKFKLIAGREYFEGDETEMKNEFQRMLSKYS